MKNVSVPLRALCLGLTLSIACPAAHAATGFESDTLVTAWSTHVGPLNPHDYGANMMFAQAFVYEPLVQYGPGGTIIPCLATSWSISPDHLTYTFTLRKNVRFSNGEPFNAQAVVKNFDAVMARKARHAWMELIGRIASYKALDEHTFTLTLNSPYAATLQELTFVRPLRFASPKTLEAMQSTADWKPVGTGPWVWQERKKGEHDIFVRHKDHWNAENSPQNGFEKLVVKVIPHAEARALALETDAVDLISTVMGDHGTAEVEPSAFALFSSEPEYTSALSMPRNTRLLAMNSGHAILEDILVRKAIMRAIDRKALREGVLLNQELAAESLMHKSLPWCDTNLSPYPYDPKDSAALLDSAGWKHVEGQKFRQKDGKPLQLSLKFIAHESLMRSMAQVIQSDLAKIGIDVRLVGEEGVAYMNSESEGNFELIFINSSGAPYAPFSYLSIMQVPGHAEYQAQRHIAQKAALDEAMNKALHSTEKSDIQKNFAEVWRILHEAEVYVPLSHSVDKTLYKKGRLKEHSFAPVSYELLLHTLQR